MAQGTAACWERIAMTLKPPTKSFPKLVMKEWPLNAVEREFGRNWDTPNARKSLSSFTRVGEDVQKRPQKDKSR